MAETLLRLTILVTQAELDRIDRWWKSGDHMNRSAGLRALIDEHLAFKETGEMPAPVEEVTEQPPMVDPMTPGALPGEYLPRLTRPDGEIDSQLLLFIQKLQPFIDDTRRADFEDRVIAGVVYGTQSQLPMKAQLVSVALCMKQLGWTLRLERKGRPRGEPARMWSAEPVTA